MRSFREALVLAFVIGDDPFQTVVGIELALAHQTCLVALDTEAEVHDGVDCRMCRDHLHHFWNCVTGLAASAVDRVAAAPSRRQFLVDLSLQIIGQSQQMQAAVTSECVAGHNSQPPAVVSTTVFGPFGSGCVANVATASNASSTVTARVTPACRHAPSNTLSSAANAPV